MGAVSAESRFGRGTVILPHLVVRADCRPDCIWSGTLKMERQVELVAFDVLVRPALHRVRRAGVVRNEEVSQAP